MNDDKLIGDSSKAKKELNWEKRINFNDLVQEMVAEDIKLAQIQIKAQCNL